MSWKTVVLLLAILSAWCFCQRAIAQVPGVFQPSLFGDFQEQGTPLLPVMFLPEGTPFEQRNLLQQRYELDYLRRPYIKQITSLEHQGLVTPNFFFDTLTTGLEFGFSPSDQYHVSLYYLPTLFGGYWFSNRANAPREFGEEYRALVRFQPTDRLKGYAQVGLFHFAQADTIQGGVEVLGGGLLNYALRDRISLLAGFKRDIVGNSLLSATGLNLPGTNTLVGRDTYNLFLLGTILRPTKKLSVSLSYVLGFVAGSQIPTNPLNQCNIFADRVLYSHGGRAHIQSIDFYYLFIAAGYKYNELGFGNLSFPPQTGAAGAAILQSSEMGQTQIPPPAGSPVSFPGGYFSPQQWLAHGFGLNISGRLVKQIYYGGGVALGFGNAHNSGGAPLFASQSIGMGGSAFAAIHYRMSKHVTAEQGWYFLQAGTVYQRNILYSQVKYTF